MPYQDFRNAILHIYRGDLLSPRDKILRRVWKEILREYKERKRNDSM